LPYVLRGGRSRQAEAVVQAPPKGGVAMNRLLRNRLWLLIAGIALLGATAMVVASSQKAVPVQVEDAQGQLTAPTVGMGASESAAAPAAHSESLSTDVSQAAGTSVADAVADELERGADQPSVRAATILVHVAGAVRAPGVYQLPADARIAHAVEAAGGAADDADVDSVNLALRLQDGQQVFIPQKPAVVPDSHTSTSPQKAPVEPAVPGRVDTTVSLPEPSPGESAVGGGDARPRVNINVAGVDELCELPGIGQVLAQRIIEYRTKNGPFGRVEDLILVSGIGEAKLAKLLPVAAIR
jgi:competence protein ComEA